MELAPLEKGFLSLLSPPATADELGVEQVPAQTAGKAGYVEGGCVITGPPDTAQPQAAAATWECGRGVATSCNFF